MGGEGSLNDFKFGTFIQRFPSDGAACMAVKGLTFVSVIGLYPTANKKED